MLFLPLVPLLPFAGFLILALAGSRLPRKAAAAVGCSSVGLSFVVAAITTAGFLSGPAPTGGEGYRWVLWRWLDVAGFAPGISLHLDQLSLVMVLVVTGVGFLIHLYSTEYMEGDESYAKFFAYMNLFVCMMLFLVLGDNLLLLYLGWEGVGLCSYLLIGFWYADPANGRAARKAFIVTRIGDTAMGIGLFLLFRSLGTLDIQEMLSRAQLTWSANDPAVVLAAALLLGGAVGKSAQLPLQTWLPDAMAGPTPVSALIHAATMVTAGVYLIARTHVLFELAPPVLLAVGAVGAVTLLLSGFAALVQTDIKRVLAYSTISQIGYMFLGLGVGAWSAAMFHFMTHAFFKALLFLGAGAVIISLHHEQDIFKMGGLRRRLPLVFWTFLAGGLALASFPLIDSGFYSKELILSHVWQSEEQGAVPLWAAGVLGAFLTSLYTYRLIIIVFFGEERGHVAHKPGLRISLPLAILAVLAIVGGFVETPEWMGGPHAFTRFMDPVFRTVGEVAPREGHEGIAGALPVAVSLLGLAVAAAVWLWRPALAAAAAARTEPLRLFLRSGWGFDWLYDRLVVRPFIWIARVNRRDVVDLVYAALAKTAAGLSWVLGFTQTGRVRWYALGIVAGAILLISIVVFGS